MLQTADTPLLQDAFSSTVTLEGYSCQDEEVHGSVEIADVKRYPLPDVTGKKLNVV
jgi:hypothetical protein